MTDNSQTDVRLSPALEIKAATEGKLTGYASMWGGPPDSYGDIVAKGAFRRTLAERSPIMLWSHDRARIIGRWTEVVEDNVGLYVEGKLNLSTTEGRNAYEHVRAGDVSGASIGWAPTPTGIRKNGDGSQTLTDIELYEISVVAFPACARTRLQIESKRELQELLHKNGLPKAAAMKIANGGWRALVGDEPPAPSDLKSYAERILASAQLVRNVK